MVATQLAGTQASEHEITEKESQKLMLRLAALA